MHVYGAAVGVLSYDLFMYGPNSLTIVLTQQALEHKGGHISQKQILIIWRARFFCILVDEGEENDHL